MDPTDEEISQVIDFANLDPQQDRTLVIQALKKKDRNVEAVVMEYFDDATSFRQKYNMTWNESYFQGERNEVDNQTGISFHVESLTQNDDIPSGTPPRDPYASGAPSRPPSRSNDKSPLGRMVDWQAGTVGGNAPEDEMQRALRESAQEAGISLEHQESGIMATQQGPYFGPATRNDYDRGEWGMVLGGSSHAQNLGPKASARTRIDGAPALLVQGNNPNSRHSLGGLLTILHEIPLARNVLLGCGEPADSYGFSSEWWKGQEILPPDVLARMQAGDLPWGEERPRPLFEDELHRLMAFLDSTERSYGTASVLYDLVPYAGFNAEKQFYEHLEERNETKLDPLCHLAYPALVFGDVIDDEKAKFAMLEMQHRRDEYREMKTLYEALDRLMWHDAALWNGLNENSRMAVFKETGEVMVIKIGGEGPLDSIEIPTDLYPERYLLSRKEEATRIQQALCETKRAMAEIARKGSNHNRWRNDWNQDQFTKEDTIKAAADQWKAYEAYLDTTGRLQTMVASGFDTNQFPDYKSAPPTLSAENELKLQKVHEVLKLTDTMLSELEAKVEQYTEQMEKLTAKQRFLGKLLTDPHKAGRPKPMTCKHYKLRGIATDLDVVFVCQRHEVDLIELDTPQQPDQWWKLAYSPGSEQPVTAVKVNVEDVLREVWQLTKNPVLVYATEEAITAAPTPLSGPLDRFVRAENKAFRQELTQEENQEAAWEDVEQNRGMQLDPISPSKRKHRDASVDSMDTNRASIGSDGKNGFDNPFEGQTVELAGAGIEPPTYSQVASSYAAVAASEPLTPPPVLPPRPAGFYDVDTVQSATAEEPQAPEMQERQGMPLFRTNTHGEGQGGDKITSMEHDLNKL